MEHTLKTDADVFEAVVDGRKTFEIRLDDRGFQERDTLMLQKTEHTGAEMKEGAPLVVLQEYRVEVGYILRGPRYGLMDGWVIMSIHPPRYF